MRKSATALLFKIKDRFGFPALQDMLAKVPQSTLEGLKEDIPEVSSLIKTKKKDKGALREALQAMRGDQPEE